MIHAKNKGAGTAQLNGGRRSLVKTIIVSLELLPTAVPLALTATTVQRPAERSHSQYSIPGHSAHGGAASTKLKQGVY